VVRNFHVRGITVSATDDATSSPSPPVSDVLVPREELVQIRSGAWRLLVPMRHVDRVLGAALPAARPAPGGEGTLVVAIGRDLLPVLFAAALLGAEEVSLEPSDQMVLLRDGGRRALLWVQAVEEVVEFLPVPPPPGPADLALVAAWSGAGRPLAVLDVPRLLELAA
jgi:hypothetical protein